MKDLKPYQKIFHQIHQYSNRMAIIIGNFLLSSRLESNDRSVEEKMNVDIPRILKTLCANVEQISGEKHHLIQLRSESNVYISISGSKAELKSLLFNIVTNAVKYVLPKRKIHVTWYRDSDRAVFGVSNTSIGSVKAHFSRMTECFYHVDKTRLRESGGAAGPGLLAYCQTCTNVP